MCTSLRRIVLAAGIISFQISSIAALYVRNPGESTAGLKKRAVTYYEPAAGGGSMLTDTGKGLGEPLNVIISGLSSPDVLTNSGFLNYARSIGFDEECLNKHLGDLQAANLGDGNGWKDQEILLREVYDVGTCLQSLIGGNHFRMWHQNGTTANSGALFLAVSLEKSAFKSHTISKNGYNRGRDKLVAAAITGQTHQDGVMYSTASQDVLGLLTAGTAGINHDIAVDGIVKLLTVTIV